MSAALLSEMPAVFFFECEVVTTIHVRQAFQLSSHCFGRCFSRGLLRVRSLRMFFQVLSCNQMYMRLADNADDGDYDDGDDDDDDDES